MPYLIASLRFVAQRRRSGTAGRWQSRRTNAQQPAHRPVVVRVMGLIALLLRW